MYHLRLEFAYSWAPWLYLLLIPALAIPLFFHFRVPKRFRRTRNRIISLVLYTLVVTLSVSVLTGLTFAYSVDNPENEIILLVDVSDTQEKAREKRDDFVEKVLNESSYDGYRVGVVTFGFTQNYAVPLTYEVEEIFQQYLDAELPDTSATDIAAALRYASSLFDSPQTSKIVLITDGKETDEKAASAIGAITARGTIIDTVQIGSEYEEDLVQVIGVTFPDYHVSVNDVCDIGITLQSKTQIESLAVELYDNGEMNEETGSVRISLQSGTTTVGLKSVFTTEGLHKIQIKLRAEGDGLTQNNEYHSYFYLEVFNNVLILERYDGESEALKALMTQEEAGYQVNVQNITTSTELPKSVDELRQYDQVILNNIANADFPEGFDKMLYTYVHEYGGGLFTVGGEDEQTGDAHAYNRADMSGTLYQQMLPVQAINYTPPVGVVIIIDVSGSMDSDGGNGLTKRDLAKQGAIACLEALSERDYVGIMTLDSVYSVVLPMTSRLQESKIVAAIEGVNRTGGTVFSDAIRRAGQMLTDLEEVYRRHMIIVTDGIPTDSDSNSYLQAATDNYKNNGITLSIMGINMAEGSGEYQRMEVLCDEEHGNGRVHCVTGAASDIAYEMYADLNVSEIKEVIPEPFNPIVSNSLSVIFNGVEYGIDGGNRNTMNVQLGGFYGVKVRSIDYLLLTGDFQVPLYAQWKFGAGSVGSFMSDLSGRWSADFLADSNGQRFLLNVVANLMPTQNIRVNEMTADFKEENYINQLNVFTGLEEGQYVRGEIVDTESGKTVSLNTPPEDGQENQECYVTLYLGADNGYSRSSFVIKKKGVYRIALYKCDAQGNVLTTYEFYKSFSFSEEYNLFFEENTEIDTGAMLEEVAERGRGHAVKDLSDPWEIFSNFETELKHTFDPRFLFSILAIVFFLLDVAVRKFKFKWPHELIREHKLKKMNAEK